MNTSSHTIQGGRSVGRRLHRLPLLGGVPLAFVLTAAAVPQSVSVDGVPLSAPFLGVGEGELDALRDAFLHEPITLDAGEVVLHRSREELGASLSVADVDDALARARRERGGPFGGALDRVFGRRPPSVRWVPRVDERGLFAMLVALRGQIDRPPSAPLRLRIDDPAEGRPGRLLDVTAAVQRVSEALRAGEPYVALPVLAVPAPDRPVPTLASDEFAYVLGRHESAYSRDEDSWTRASNLERAARALDDRVLGPGETLSFNEVVGERTLAHGFLPAPEVRDGAIVRGIGGGICQVATGLFDVARSAGLTVVEHHVHSNHEGDELDAAVSFGMKDLRIANPYRFPTRLDVEARGGVLRVAVESTFALPGAQEAVGATDGRGGTP